MHERLCRNEVGAFDAYIITAGPLRYPSAKRQRVGLMAETGADKRLLLVALADEIE